MERLKRFSVDITDIGIMINLYWQWGAVIRIGDDKSYWIKIKRSVKKGCVLSPPDLFSIIDEVRALEGFGGGRKKHK